MWTSVPPTHTIVTQTQTAPTPMAPSRAHANLVMMAMGTTVQVPFHFCLLPRLQVAYLFAFGIQGKRTGSEPHFNAEKTKVTEDGHSCLIPDVFFLILSIRN